MAKEREVIIRLRAKDVMTSPVITVRPDASVRDVAALMLTHHISGLPVVTSEGELVGIVTETDLLYFRAACDGSGAHLFAGTFEEHLRNACP